MQAELHRPGQHHSAMVALAPQGGVAAASTGRISDNTLQPDLTCLNLHQHSAAECHRSTTSARALLGEELSYCRPIEQLCTQSAHQCSASSTGKAAAALIYHGSCLPDKQTLKLEMRRQACSAMHTGNGQSCPSSVDPHLNAFGGCLLSVGGSLAYRGHCPSLVSPATERIARTLGADWCLLVACLNNLIRPCDFYTRASEEQNKRTWQRPARC